MYTPLHWITRPPLHLATLARPRGGDWLEDELRAMRRQGLDLLVSALTRAESDELDLAAEATLAEATGLRFLAFPIVDRGVPDDPRALTALADALADALRDGQRVAIHCRQGIGRASLLAAAALLRAGVETPAEAWALIAAARGCDIPDTAAQRAFIAWWWGAYPP